jgi:hypothetical protein
LLIIFLKLHFLNLILLNPVRHTARTIETANPGGGDRREKRTEGQSRREALVVYEFTDLQAN